MQAGIETGADKRPKADGKYFLDFLNKSVLEKLTERERRIAMWRTKDIFGIGKNEKTYRELASAEGVCIMTATHIVAKIIRKIKHRIEVINQRMGEPQVVIKYIDRPKDSIINLPILYKPIEALGEMSVRLSNGLSFEEIKTIEQLIVKQERDLLRIPNLGKKSVEELKELLEKQGLTLGMKV